MKRTITIVCYDICDPTRLRQVYQTCRAYGQHMQYSVFRADLTEMRRVQLIMALDAIIHHGDDQVLFIRVGPSGGCSEDSFWALGKPYLEPPKGPRVL
ncbi:MAG: CRISPR-associated endonuclease Cas2 [Deltaproteobacteria bacterium CG_4_9_14_3_um_filter_63_12]|nr:MAG: CRISPR-associated endonuclease Cas2 [Deltaproteobacteria bacterium CG_4_9_14_3_um_filter_63_12]